MRTRTRSRAVELGIDIGGTFTDIVLFGERGEVRTAKVLTTPREPERAVLAGVRKLLAEEDLPVRAVARLIHATTLATNAIVERKGARTALVTTRGFRDVLETRNELRYDLYDLLLDLPPVLIQRALRLGVAERVRYDGKVLHEPEHGEVKDVVDHIVREGVEAVAICFIHSYVNPQNEQVIAAALRRAAPELSISLSSEVLAEIGEYGRFSTTAVNAYVQPRVARYLRRLEASLAQDEFAGVFTVMASSGGTMPITTAERFPVRLIESGPAAGAHAAAVYGATLGIDRLLSLDIGGTTAKMCVIQKGKPSWTTDFEVARLSRFKKGSGLTLRVPTVDLIEIGAGGGSIARANSLDLIDVGPESAGSDPGPACYGLGGRFATVTDADLLLGYLNPENFLGGEMALDPAAAERAVMDAVGKPLGMNRTRAAYSINSIVNENMANAARVYTAERGIDVRSFTMFAFGGAGPVHACGVAEKLGMRSVVVPPAGGVLSAIGCVLAPMTFDFVRGFKSDLHALDVGRANVLLGAMVEEGLTLLRQAGFARGITIEPSADMRFIGQRSEVNVLLISPRLSAAFVPRLERRFRAAYRDRYGRDVPEVKPEIVNLRVTVRGPANARAVAKAHVPTSVRRTAPKAYRMASFDGRNFVKCPTWDRAAIGRGQRVVGPAVVEASDSTAVLPPRWVGVVDRLGNLILSRRG